MLSALLEAAFIAIDLAERGLRIKLRIGYLVIAIGWYVDPNDDMWIRPWLKYRRWFFYDGRVNRVLSFDWLGFYAKIEWL